MFPLHDDNQRLHGRPYVTYLLIAINAIIFLAEVIVTANFSDRAATNALLQTYGAIPKKILGGDIFSAISSMFLHGGIAHLIGNMLFLFVFGDNIEDKFGRIKYVLIYIAWGIAAAYAHSFYAVSTGGGDIPAIGASGAVSGVLVCNASYFGSAKSVGRSRLFCTHWWFSCRSVNWICIEKRNNWSWHGNTPSTILKKGSSKYH